MCGSAFLNNNNNNNNNKIRDELSPDFYFSKRAAIVIKGKRGVNCPKRTRNLFFGGGNRHIYFSWGFS
jgi:hypothetical protein